MLSVPPNSLLEEVNSDGLLVLACENAFAEFLDHGRLSNSTIAHDNHLEKSSVPGFFADKDMKNFNGYLLTGKQNI